MKYLRLVFLYCIPIALAACVAQGGAQAPVVTTYPVPPPSPIVLPAKDPNALRVDILSVGAGMCQVVECPGTSSAVIPYVIDCGTTNSDGGMSKEQTTQYVNTTLDQYSSAPVVVLSHWDQDHENWIPTVMGSRKVSSIWLAGARKNYKNAGSWITAQENDNGAKVYENLKAGEGFKMGSCGVSSDNTPATAYGVTVNAGSSSNAASLVFAVQFGSAFAMLMGDATGETQTSAETNLTNAKLKPPYPMITGSHHGAISNGSNSADWANFAQPKLIVYSAGKSYWHPRCEATFRYRTYLQTASQHDTVCGQNKSWQTQQISKGEYVTSISGNVVIDQTNSGVVAVPNSDPALPLPSPAPQPNAVLTPQRN